MVRDTGVLMWAVRHHLISEVKPQVMQPRSPQVSGAGDAKAGDLATEDTAGGILVKLLPLDGNEQVRACRCVLGSVLG